MKIELEQLMDGVIAIDDGERSFSIVETTHALDFHLALNAIRVFTEMLNRLAPPNPTAAPKRERRHDIAQLLNPRSHRYVKIDRTVGGITSHKKSDGPYKNIPIISPKSND